MRRIVKLSTYLTLVFATAAVGSDASLALPRSSASDHPSQGVLRALLPIQQNDGAPLALVFFDLLGSTGSEDGDQALRSRIESVIALRVGDSLPAAAVESRLDRVRQLDGIREASVSLYAGSSAGEVVLVVSATLGSSPAAGNVRAQGFPLLVSTDRSLLRFQLAGAHGVYADHNPWFASPATFTGRSPIATDPPGAGWSTWAESAIEYGLAGATRIADAPATVFGEVTAISSAAWGNDLFRTGARYRNRIEKAYGGFAWTDRDRQRSLKLSAGRQNWQLYGGFLFSRFAAGANAGPHPGLYLSPRTTYQRAILLDAGSGPWRFEAFDVDPAELDRFDSGSRYRGANLRRVNPQGIEWGLTGYTVPESNAQVPLASGGSVPREGLRVWSGRLGWANAFGVERLGLLGEYASQDSTQVDWDARAWYAQVGYGFASLPWSPHLTYRRASFSGDDPDTTTQEAFDAQLSSGLDEWVQGIGFKKVVSNSNLDTHRLRLNLGNSPRLNYTLDYFRLEANRTVPDGFRHYGDELNAAVRWAITPQLFLLGVAGVAWPGDEMERLTAGQARPWSTFQLSLFWGL